MDTQPIKAGLPVTSPFKKLPYIVQLPLTGVRPCLDLINTIEWRLQPEQCRDHLKEYSDLIAIALRLNLISVDTYTSLSATSQCQPQEAEKAIRAACAFRDGLTRIIDAISGTPETDARRNPKEKDLQLFTSARYKAIKSDCLSWNGERMVVCPQPEEEGLDHPWLLFVRDADDLFRSPLASRVKICEAAGCGWSFLDTSKNGTRRWCSMKICGNRKKAERFRSRGPQD